MDFEEAFPDSSFMSLDRPCRGVQSATQIVLRWLVFVPGLFVLISAVSAATLEVQVQDPAGMPVGDVVVAVKDGGTAPVSPTVATARRVSMDQVNMRFDPQILVVPVGASVTFPNSDTVSHQVYSFSPAKPFQLSLYKGATHPPVSFDKPGLVVLGCNIHDSMVGYVYVTDARGYGQTDAQGRWSVSNVTGSTTVTIWSPLIADTPASLTRSVNVTGNGQQTVVFKLAKALRSSPEPRPRRSDWDY